MSNVEPLTPVWCEHKLRELMRAMTAAQKQLAAARDAECDAEIALVRATVAAESAAPRVSRGEVTVAEREAVVRAGVLEETEAVLRAKTARRVAQDLIDMCERHQSSCQTLSSSVRTAYQVIGAA